MNTSFDVAAGNTAFDDFTLFQKIPETVLNLVAHRIQASKFLWA